MFDSEQLNAGSEQGFFYLVRADEFPMEAFWAPTGTPLWEGQDLERARRAHD